MKGVISIYHHSYTFFFVVLILFRHVFSISINTFSSTESLTISNNQTIVSLGDVFELGFFKLESSRDGDRWYLGIWYKAISERTYVWVANRDNPLSNSVGTLKISNANLVLLDQSEVIVWSTNLTGVARSPLVAELFPNGNFVLRDSKINGPDGFLWQSFDFPTDTLLPQMKLGWDIKTGRNRFLRSWKSPYDPSSGDLSYKLETRVLSEFFIRKRDSPMFRSGPWDGIQFSGMPDMQQWSYINIVYNFTENREEATYSYRATNQNIYPRLTMSSPGLLQLFTWSSTTLEWNLVWFSSKDECDIYAKCSPYAYCDVSTSPVCNCIRGFQPRNEQNWVLNGGSGECVRKTQLSCNGDGFFQLKRAKLPDTTLAIVDTKIGLKECEKRCITNCNCTAYANTDIRNGGSGCVIWTRELEDIRTFAAGGQDLFVRLASVDLVLSGKEKKKISGKNISLIVGVSLMLLLSFIMFCIWKRKHKLPRAVKTPTGCQERNENMQMNEVLKSSRVHLSGEDNTEVLELPLMDFEAIAIATDNFSVSNKLGEGGFGIVYKGRLLDGQEIAVKRLSKMSHQGTNEFKNEVKLIANLQHINLVRLLGCFIDADEKILVYEYLENLSLDFYLFDKALSSKLNWQRRLDITNGIARGLLYLHQDSRCRIIHRDLKASNILLDKNLTPKISDFGMARIFGRDEMEANTRRIVGTYGYMSPEYAMDGIFSVKSDVFSFGIVILEIVSGRRNRGFYNSSQDINLLNYVWRHWKEGKGLEIVDPIITSSSSLSTFQPHEILRCIQIGLLCVQECAEDRPTMSSVVLMLGSETTTIPQPKPPGYCIQRSPAQPNLWSTTQPDEESWTVNQITLSVIDAR